MTNEEAIKYLQQLYPNGGHCWLDEQRIEAIGMAVKALQEKPVSDELEKVVEEIVDPTVLNAYGVKDIANRLRRTMIEPVSEELEKAATKYAQDKYMPVQTSQAFKAGAQWQKQRDNIPSKDWEEAMQHSAPDNIGINDLLYWRNGFITGANWKKSNLWKSADGDDLPEIDREVIVLIKYNAQHNIHDEEYPTYRVGFGHRPDSKGWDGKSVTTGKVEHYTPKTYDKGGWNIPNIIYWLDVELPKEIEL